MLESLGDAYWLLSLKGEWILEAYATKNWVVEDEWLANLDALLRF